MSLETTKESIMLDDQSSNVVNINENNDNLNQNSTEIVLNDNVNVTLTSEIKISIDNTEFNCSFHKDNNESIWKVNI